MGRKKKPLAKAVHDEISAQQQAADKAVTTQRLLTAMGTKRQAIEELCAKLKCSPRGLMDAIFVAQQEHYMLTCYGNLWSIEHSPPPRQELIYESRPDGTYLFGATGDNHLCSKYARLDVLNDLYDIFVAEGVDRVFNTGNWIDGEARFNRTELISEGHGTDSQLRYLAENYPQRDGLVTYAVAGDDHEGWLSQREGIDIGAAAQTMMREYKRNDWVDLGYMEAYVTLRHSVTGKSTKMLVAHPGGGSAYALSYSIQKIVEVMDGGEKPAVGLWGHYHKLWAGNIRNVWCIQTGCTKDQGSFERKKKIDAHVGGVVCKLTQDPRTGAIVRCRPELIRYFNKGYYNHRWSHSGPVTLPKRAA